MSDLVFWQEPGDNYVRVGNAAPTVTQIKVGGYEGVFRDVDRVVRDVKRWGSVETVNDELLRRVT